MVFLISAVRAIVEMLGLCLLGQGLLYLLAGKQRAGNPIYQLFALVTRGPRRLVAACLPQRSSPVTVGIACFVVLFALWIGLAIARKFF